VTIEAGPRRNDNPGILIFEDGDGIRRQETSRGMSFSARKRAYRIDRRTSGRPQGTLKR
jgi:hypothetical protein